MSSGWLSGQLAVIRNSALVSILPDFASGFITSSAMKKEGDDLQSLEQHHAEGIDFSRG